ALGGLEVELPFGHAAGLVDQALGAHVGFIGSPGGGVPGVINDERVGHSTEGFGVFLPCPSHGLGRFGGVHGDGAGGLWVEGPAAHTLGQVGRELEATRASETQGIRGVYGDGEFLTLGLGEDLLEGSIVGLVNSVMAPLAVEHIAEGGYALEGRDTLTKEV